MVVIFVLHKPLSRNKAMLHNKPIYINNAMFRNTGILLLMFLTYQLLTVGYLLTVAMTGDGGLGFDSGEGARDTATTSKEGSRRVNYPILTQGGSDNK